MAKALARRSEKTSALRFSEAIAALRDPAMELAAEERRRAQLEHARQIDQGTAWDRRALLRTAATDTARRAEVVRERVFEHVVGPSLRALTVQVAGTATSMRAALGRLLDVTRLREGPAVAATHIQAAAERARPGVELPARPARRSSPTR